jgi:hypothetical protein
MVPVEFIFHSNVKEIASLDHLFRYRDLEFPKVPPQLSVSVC